MASAVTGDDQKAKAGSTKLRGLDDDPGSNPVALVPPPGIWGEAAATSPVFEAAPETASDNTITAIELFPSEGRELVLPAGKPLIISPKASPVTTRSVDSASEETIVPYGYDEDLQLFFPVGFTDNSGNIHIDFLPPATSGNFLLSEEEQERSLGGSVKLFFKKLIRRKSVNRLVLHRFSQENGWYEVTDEPAKMQAVLAGKPDSKALLLVHGIIGDTSFMLECMKEIADKSSFLLTFDYENLSADISDIASSLHELLSGAGLFEKDMPELVIIAHSMGGLVARWLVEQNKPARNISRLLMIGTPSGGSEAAKLVQSVFGLLTHALNTTGILKAAIAGLGFLLRRLKADPGNTLKELQTGSKTIEQLRKSIPNSSTIYKVIGGDTALLEKGYAGSDFFLKRLSHVMKNKLVYPGLTYTVFGNEANDMAVTIKSMQDITDFDAGKHSFIAASNHSGYFTDKECRQYIVDYVYN
jgi:pimeloyl-ACP methyl ester carboxylesterase